MVCPYYVLSLLIYLFINARVVTIVSSSMRKTEEPNNVNDVSRNIVLKAFGKNDLALGRREGDHFWLMACKKCFESSLSLMAIN